MPKILNISDENERQNEIKKETSAWLRPMVQNLLVNVEMKEESTLEELELGEKLGWVEDPGNGQGQT